MQVRNRKRNLQIKLTRYTVQWPWVQLERSFLASSLRLLVAPLHLRTDWLEGSPLRATPLHFGIA